MFFAVFVGHSDGASIALIYAGCGLAQVNGLILEAPHVFVEDVTIESIARIRSAYETTDLKARLARYHGSNTEGMFRRWTDIWLHPEFRNWNIEEHLPGIRCPVLILQGEDDEYGTSKQIDAIATQVNGEFASVLLAECGHAPHVDQRTIAEDMIVRFVNTRVLSRV